MEYAILGIVLIMGIAIVVLTRSKGDSDTKSDETISKRKVPETIEEKFTNPIEADPRKHSTMDAPMIRSRFEKMKIQPSQY